jgi:hypothetical protein
MPRAFDAGAFRRLRLEEAGMREGWRGGSQEQQSE